MKQTHTQFYGKHYIDDADIDAVTKILKGDFLTNGQSVSLFEQAIAQYTGAKYAVACVNGTAALHLACLAIGITKGDIVIVPSITFVATANAVLYCGGEVVFCDVDPNSGLATLETLKEAHSRCSKPPKAFIGVDLAGQVACTGAITSYCAQHNIITIGDSCHAFGSDILLDGDYYKVGHNKNTNITTFSFHAIKNITTAEGGCVTTNNAQTYKLLQQFRNHGLSHHGVGGDDSDNVLLHNPNIEPHYHFRAMQYLGYNYRLTDMQAALGLSQLQKINHFKKKRDELKKLYDAALAPYYPLLKPLSVQGNMHAFWHLYIILLDIEKIPLTKNALIKALAAKNIATQVHYFPVHEQPYYTQNTHYHPLQGANQYYAQALSLPFHAHLQEQDIMYITQTLGELLLAA